MTRIGQARAALDAARAVLADLDDLALAPADEVAELLDVTAALARVVDAQRVQVAGVIAARSNGPDEESICRLLGKRSPKEAVASAFGIRAREAQDLLRMAAATSPAVGLSGGDIEIRYPRVARSLGDADISLAQAQAIVQQLEPAAPRADLELLAWAEGALVDAATDPDAPLVPELLVTQGRVYAAVLDPDGVLPNEERLRAARGLRMRVMPDGSWKFDITSPPEEGSAIKAFLDAHTAPRVAFRDDDPSADPDGGATEQDAACVDDRTLAQRRHDVLVAAVRAQAASGDAPIAGGEPPVLVLHGDIDAYTAYMRGLEHADRTLRIEHTGSIVPIETVERLLCEAQVQPVVVNGGEFALALGRSARLFNRAQRRALALRDKGCRVPGCGAPASWCEAHHVRWWERGGPTDIDNGILVCSYHHHEIHAGRLHVIADGPAPGSWRIVAELRPADRYGRNRRAGAPALPVRRAAAAAARLAPAADHEPRAGHEPAAAHADRHPAQSHAADAAPRNAVLVHDPPDVPAVRPPRRAGGVEAGVRRRLGARRRAARAAPAGRIDIASLFRVVMRT